MVKMLLLLALLFYRKNWHGFGFNLVFLKTHADENCFKCNLVAFFNDEGHIYIKNKRKFSFFFVFFSIQIVNQEQI